MAALITNLKVISVLSLYASLTSINNLLHCDYQSNIIICPEDIIVFDCSVSGGVATVWKGSIFNCGGNQILLRHRNFENGTSRTCNDGGVVAYSSEVTNNSYSSRLNVIVTPEMHNGTVECIKELKDLTSETVGTCTLILATDLEPLYEVHVSDINPNHFTIDWSRSQLPTSSCDGQTLIYNITTINCGVCPDTTSDTSIRCTNLIPTVSGQACLIIIQTQADAENNTEYSVATNLTVLLRVPSAPEITARWTKQFASILTSFNELELFFISNGIDGSPTNYTITYSDPSSGRTCDHVTILASACTSGQCNHMFDIPPVCSHSTSIAITVFATNVLGDGPLSPPVLIEFNNYNESASGTSPNIALYSIVGGISIVIILSLMLVIIMLAGFLKKINRSRSFQIPSNNQEPAQEMYSTIMSPEPIGPGINEGNSIESIIGIYTLVQSIEDKDKVTESCEVAEESTLIYENNHHEIDKTLNLDTLLIQIRHEVAPKWYQFGLAVGINKETLDEFSNFTPEECIVEILDLWLRTSVTTLTWRDVADALKETGCHRLAEKILKVYKTGILPVDQEAAESALSLEQLSMISNDQGGVCTSESNQSDTPVPPLPPKMYQ